MDGPSHNPAVLPPGLPVPSDDGAAAHLTGAALPDLALESTAGHAVGLSDPSAIGARAVLFLYPRTGVPGQPPSPGFAGEPWDSIPGARGCTPQSCGFRDLHGRFADLGVRVWGVSTNSPEHQAEFKARNHVPFDFLSDRGLRLVGSMRLPTFEFPVESGGPTTLMRRMAWYVTAGADGNMVIRRVWYPVFPADTNAAIVLAWLSENSRARRDHP